MPLAARIALFWLCVAVATGVWSLGIALVETWPLPVQLALASMVPMAGLWWHLVLFQDRLKARRAAAAAKPGPAKPGPALPEATIRDALAQVRADAAALAWDAGLRQELRLRMEHDADFARAAAPLREAERAVLLLASRGEVVRKRLALAARVLADERGRQGRGADPLRDRLRLALDAKSPVLGTEFGLLMLAATDLDPIEVARRLADRPAVETAPASLETLHQAAMLLRVDGRGAVRQAVSARLAGVVDTSLQAMLRAYLATAQAQEEVALAAIGTAPVARSA